MRNPISMMMMSLLFALNTVPAIAFAETSDSELACNLKERELDPGMSIENGIDLGDIVSQEISTNGQFTTSVEPTVQLDLDYGDQIVNLTQGPSDKNANLIFRNSRDGYAVLDYQYIEAGLGAQLRFVFGNTTLLSQSLWATVGLMPIKGKDMASMRYYDSKQSVEDRDYIPTLDTSLKALKSLHNHDTLTYATKGGLVFWAGAGFAFIGDITVSGLAQGEFQIKMEKVDADHAYVKITDANLKALGLQAGTLIGSVSVTEFSKYSDSLGFLININDKTGRDAFHDLIGGNAAPVQKMAASGKYESVRFMDDAHIATNGNTVRFWVGLPLLMNYTWTNNHYFDVMRKRYYSCGRSLNATYGTYVQRREGSAFGVQQQFTKAFYGTSYALQGEGKVPVARGYFGQMLWTYRGNFTLPTTFRHAMDKLAADTGLGDQLVLNVPDSVTDRLEFTSLTLRAQFGAKNTLNMIKRARSAGRNGLLSFASLLAKTYFSEVANPSIVCEAIEVPKGSLPLAGAACASAVMARTDSGVDSMIDSLNTMDQALKAGNEKAATRAFSRFGEAMLTNQFTFKTGLQLAGADLPVDYIVEGSDFYRYASLSKTVGSSGRLVRDSRSPLYRPRTGRGGADSVVMNPIQ